MASYELNSVVPSPAYYTTFIEVSPDGRFLAVGDRDLRSLYILDRSAGFHPILSAPTLESPTALVWETSAAFYVGMADGRFTYYTINLEDKKLVKEKTNSAFRGGFPITAMALDRESRTLALSVGPEVFAFRRIHATSEFGFAGNISSRFNFANEPGRLVPPFPRAICFTPNGTLVVTFCRQHIASISLEFERNSRLSSSFQTAKVDYSGLPLLRAIIHADGEEILQLTRCWIYGSAVQKDDDERPFLFINGGAAILSKSAPGAVVIRDAITQRQIQMLKHTDVIGRQVSVIAYHVLNNEHSIVTVDRGEKAKIKVWNARKTPSYPQSQSHHGSFTWGGWIAATVIIALIVALIAMAGRQMEESPKLSRYHDYFPPKSGSCAGSKRHF